MMQVIQTLGYVNISFGYIWVVEVDIDRGSYKPPRRKTTASAHLASLDNCSVESLKTGINTRTRSSITFNVSKMTLRVSKLI
jgi:hypothetical protein